MNFRVSLAPRAGGVCALVLALAGAPPLAAQQPRADVAARRAAAADGDTTERVVRRLKARTDSLARLYNDDALSAGERQRVAEQLDRTVDEVERVMNAYEERAFGRATTVRVQVAPMRSARAAEAMSRTLMPSTVANGGPRGWLGIVVNGVAVEPRMEGGELIVHYLTYPEIVSVEPSSPAERAGLVPGDTLVAYDGRDVRDVDISMTRLLKPNARVLVRIGRDGRLRDVPVTIADAPSRILLRRDDMNDNISDMRAQGTLAAAPRFPGSPRPLGGGPTALGLSRPVHVMGPIGTSTGPVGVTGVAGAQMGSITQDWARLTGVSSGVLVMRVPAGSPAAESGLRDADVIVRAGGQTVRTLPELRSVVEAAWSGGARAIAIELVRERKTRSGTLRW